MVQQMRYTGWQCFMYCPIQQEEDFAPGLDSVREPRRPDDTAGEADAQSRDEEVRIEDCGCVGTVDERCQLVRRRASADQVVV